MVESTAAVVFQNPLTMANIFTAGIASAIAEYLPLAPVDGFRKQFRLSHGFAFPLSWRLRLSSSMMRASSSSRSSK